MVTRRQFIKTTALSAAAYAFAGPLTCKTLSAQTPAENSLPNIVIVYADDMGYGDMACQNPESKIPTPNLDLLASQGARFTDAHSSSGVCTPSRYALLTGRYHWRDFHNIVNSFGQSRFKPERLTMPEMLKEKGYFTGAIGKWHLGWDWNALKKPGAKSTRRRGYSPDAFDWSKRIPGGPVDNGFDTYFGDGTINFPPYCWIENDRAVEPPTVPLNLKGKETMEGRWEFRKGPMVKDWDPYQVLPTLTKKGVEWISNRKKDKPFFLYFALPSPHAPIIPNKEFQGKTKAGGFGDFVLQTDHVVGLLLKALKDNGFEDNTIVVFSADNGPEKYAFERVRKFEHRSMGPLRGLKRDIWEGGHRIPFIVRWPGVIKPGRVSDALISQVDLMATFASVAGYKLPDKNAAEDSFDLLNLWKDNTDKVKPRNSHVHNTYAKSYAVRKGDWVLIDADTGSISKMPDWYKEMNNYDTDMPNGGLFNLAQEIGQRKNLIEMHPEKAAELRKLLKEIRQKGHSAPRLEN